MQTKPKQSKEKKVQESEPGSKGNQKCYRPNKNKTNWKTNQETKLECQVGDKEKKKKNLVKKKE